MIQNTHSNKDEFLDKILNKRSFWILVLFVISIILLFGLWEWRDYDFYRKINDDKFSAFGEFIGGTLGTFISGITLLLVYKTYLSQKNELEEQRKAIITSRTQDFIYKEIEFFNSKLNSTNGELNPKKVLDLYRLLSKLANKRGNKKWTFNIDEKSLNLADQNEEVGDLNILVDTEIKEITRILDMFENRLKEVFPTKDDEYQLKEFYLLFRSHLDLTLFISYNKCYTFLKEIEKENKFKIDGNYNEFSKFINRIERFNDILNKNRLDYEKDYQINPFSGLTRLNSSHV